MYDYDDNGTPIDTYLTDNKGVEDSVMPNDDNTNDKITTYDDDSLASDVDPTLQTKFWKL